MPWLVEECVNTTWCQALSLTGAGVVTVLSVAPVQYSPISFPSLPT